MSEINLLRNDQSEDRFDAGFVALTVARILLAIVVLIIAVYAILFFLNWRNTGKLTEVKAKVETVQAEILNNEDRNEVITRQEQIKELDALIGKHVYWSYLFPELARVTLRSATFTQIEADREGLLTMTANLPNYADIEKFMQIFDLPEYNQQFSNVRILSISTVQSEDVIRTQVRLQLMFNPEYIKGRM